MLIAPRVTGWSMSCSLPACHHQPLCPQMCSTCTCAGVALRLLFRTKIRNKTSTAGAHTLPMDKSSGKFSRNGSGICVLNWVIICTQRLCASLSLQKPKQRPIPLPHPRTPPSLSERERALHQTSGPDTAEQSEEQTSPALKGLHHHSDSPVIYGAPEWAGTSRVGLFAGADAGAATRRHAPLSNQPPALPTRTAR